MFAKYFWKGCELNDYERNQYTKYVEVLTLFARGQRLARISDTTGVGPGSVGAWTKFEQRPKLGHYLREFIKRGPSRPGWVWLSVNNTSRHSVPLGPMVQVPLKIVGWDDVRQVLDDLAPDQGHPPPERYHMFGFLLGMTIGDAGKKRQKNWHRHIELTLSMRYLTNEKLGDFVCECAHAIQLRMKKMKNRERYAGKPNGFYVWESQSSALVDWIFNVCLGLEDDELTTYDPVRMQWAIEAPREFRVGLVQGLSESDGSVNVSGQEVELWIGPSWDFVSDLLGSFDIKSFRSREALTIAKSQVTKALDIPIFAPHLRTVRYQKFEKLAKAQRISHGRRLPVEIRQRIAVLAGQGLSVPAISEWILDEFGMIPSFEAVQRWARNTMGTREL